MVDQSHDVGNVGTFAITGHWVRLEPMFPLSASEQRLVQTAPFRHTPDGWRRFALNIHDCVIHGYRTGEMDFRRMMQVMRSCSIGCQEPDRIELLTVTGRVINPTSKKQDVPPLRAQLKTHSGQVVYSWTIAPPAPSLAPGESKSFNSAEVSVPPGGEELTITLGGDA